MAPIVRKVKTAFLFYQSENLQKIRGELGPQASMGEAMTEVSAGSYSDMHTQKPQEVSPTALPITFCPVPSPRTAC
eukprot:scaffold2357_cov167-Amphora_coffeaeformis.AAC.18